MITSFLTDRPVEMKNEVVMGDIFQLRNIIFSWSENDDPCIDIRKLSGKSGEKIFIEGPSGVGKSTLLSILSGIVEPSSGELSILGRNVRKLGGVQRDALRADHMGIIFQMFNLLPYLSVTENVTLPCSFSAHKNNTLRKSGKNIKDEAKRLLARMGLDSKYLLGKAVSDLSTGQQQRVAAARALLGSPEIIIADEPTSSLDNANTEAFLEILFEECSLNNSCLLFASHDLSLAHFFDTTITLDAGCSSELKNSKMAERKS